MNPGFNHTKQCTFIRQTNAESLGVLNLIFAEIMVCKVKQFLASRKIETPLHITCKEGQPSNGDRQKCELCRFEHLKV